MPTWIAESAAGQTTDGLRLRFRSKAGIGEQRRRAVTAARDLQVMRRFGVQCVEVPLDRIGELERTYEEPQSARLALAADAFGSVHEAADLG